MTTLLDASTVLAMYAFATGLVMILVIGIGGKRG